MMADSEWKREKKTTDKGGGKYLLEWIDERGETLCSMEIMIEDGDVGKTIDMNYRLLREQNEVLFVKPPTEEEIAMMMAGIEENTEEMDG